MLQYGFFSGLPFPEFGMNMDIYSLNLRIQSEYGRKQTGKNSLFGKFPRSVGGPV